MNWLRWHLDSFGIWRARTTERWALRIAWAMPRWLVYWCSIRLMAHATTGQYSSQIVPDLTAMDALKRWDAEGGEGGQHVAE